MTEDDREWSAGPKIEVTGSAQLAGMKRAEEKLRLAELAGDHLWTVIVQYLVEDPAAPLNLDSENMAGPPVLGCFRCEEEWSPRLATRRCKGTAKWQKIG